MKRLNNKGITTAEVLVSFVIVTIITTSLFSTVTNYNQKRLVEGYKTKIYAYKNILTKEIQDDFIKIGLTNAETKTQIDGAKLIYIVNCDLKDGTKRKLVVEKQYTKSTYHNGIPDVDDEFMIKYGKTDDEYNDTDDVLEYPIPNVGESTTDNGKIAYDLSINNVLISVKDDKLLSIYIGFYHPELMTRYSINILSPINFVSKSNDLSQGFDVKDAVKNSKKYTFNTNGGTGTITPLNVTIGNKVTLPGKGEIIRRGYALKEWNTQSDGSGKSYALGEEVVPDISQSNDVTLYAIWTQVDAVKRFNPEQIVQTYNVEYSGKYFLRVWGAQGGNDGPSGGAPSKEGGYGGYAQGYIYLNAGEKLYIAVGGRGQMVNGSVTTAYNGGGSSSTGTGAGGGGATHIAFATGQLTNLKSKKDQIIIVAGGGGGAGDNAEGGAGGGATGNAGSIFDEGNIGGTPGSLLAPNETYFGKGQTANGQSPAGGGGYYGGLLSQSNANAGGGGGCGYIGNERLYDKLMVTYKGRTNATPQYLTYDTVEAFEEPTDKKAKKGAGYAIVEFIND